MLWKGNNIGGIEINEKNSILRNFKANILDFSLEDIFFCFTKTDVLFP